MTISAGFYPVIECVQTPFMNFDCRMSIYNSSSFLRTTRKLTMCIRQRCDAIVQYVSLVIERIETRL